MGREFLFTSESVTEGHPDKICDRVSDAVLDEVVTQDPTGRVACETFATVGMVMVGGEITTTAITRPERKPSRMGCRASGRLRSASVSSMRRMNCPPCRRAKSQQNSAVRAPPMWR